MKKKTKNKLITAKLIRMTNKQLLLSKSKDFSITVRELADIWNTTMGKSIKRIIHKNNKTGV